MTPEQIRELRRKSKEELISIIVKLDRKLFHIIKDDFKYKPKKRTLKEFFKK